MNKRKKSTSKYQYNLEIILREGFLPEILLDQTYLYKGMPHSAGFWTHVTLWAIIFRPGFFSGLNFTTAVQIYDLSCIHLHTSASVNRMSTGTYHIFSFLRGKWNNQIISWEVMEKTISAFRWVTNVMAWVRYHCDRTFPIVNSLFFKTSPRAKMVVPARHSRTNGLPRRLGILKQR